MGAEDYILQSRAIENTSKIFQQFFLIITIERFDFQTIIFFQHSHRNTDDFAKFCHNSSSVLIKIRCRNIFSALPQRFLIPKIFFLFGDFIPVSSLRNSLYVQKQNPLYGNILYHKNKINTKISFKKLNALIISKNLVLTLKK